ncbi:MAG: hypothetical protein H6551_06710 [Chitinophagales bacterium]|nr:hypothetical protein [Chitinophagaceae bacterium]MCB9064821.1 hypothetical protein [Chitinophagales bacterium]
MTEKEFRHVVRSDNRAEEAFNYIFIVVSIALGAYWLIKVDVQTAFSEMKLMKVVLRIAAVVLPVVFSITILRSLSLNKKVINISSKLEKAAKLQVVDEYLETKKECTEFEVSDKRVNAYTYYTKFGIPVYLYVHLHEDFLLFCIRRKDNFSFREIFDMGAVSKSQKALKLYLETELKKNI